MVAEGGSGGPSSKHPVGVPTEKLAEYCRRWKISELSVFGSILREDFGPGSDIDFLVSFSPEADWSLLDHVLMEEELSALIGRKAELVSRRAIERSPNWIRRKSILESAEPYYVEG